VVVELMLMQNFIKLSAVVHKLSW